MTQHGRNEATRISIESGEPYISRHPDDIARYFDGLGVLVGDEQPMPPLPVGPGG